MRLSTEDLYYYYFSDQYKNINAMNAAFAIQKSRDKEGIYKNKKYLQFEVFGFYNYNDVAELLKYREEVANTIAYAQQLVIDIEAIMSQYKIRGAVGKLSKLVGIIPQTLNNLDISYENAVKTINIIETKIKSLSIEAIMDLKLELQRVTNG